MKFSGQIVIPDDEPSVMVPSKAFNRLNSYNVRSFNSRPSNVKDLIDRIGNAEIVINIRSSSQFSSEVLDQSPSLKMISVWGTGTDNIDLQAAQQKKICVSNTPAVARHTLAEHTLMLMLAAGRRIVDVDRRVRNGEWPRGMITELHGKTLGIIGTGAIGTEVARLGKSIGMNIIAWTFHPDSKLAESIPLQWATFDDIFIQSDVVSVHVRHSPDTHRFIKKKHFDLMKPSALFINTARGDVVDELELIHALKNGTIASAGLDVFSKEPLEKESPLFEMQNVVLTPHSGGISPETTEAGLLMAIENVLAFIKGSPIHTVTT